MMNIKGILSKKATKPAIQGSIIALIAIVIATLASAYVTYNHITFDSIMLTQQNNVALWVLDIMPFLFMLWGQQMHTAIVEEADTMIVAQTSDLWQKTQELRKKIKLESQQDTLTQLPNSSQFMGHLEQCILSSTQHHDQSSFLETISGLMSNESPFFSVILLDIDNFKAINNTLGSHHGDTLLKKVGVRLKSTLTNPEIFIARVGGDDFALAVSNCNESRAIKIVTTIREAFKSPFHIHKVPLMIEVSIGISIYPQHGNLAKDLLQHAEIAMYACKKQVSDYAFYNPSLNAHDINDLILRAEINRAFGNNELCLHYQPKLDANNQVHEVEALVRWQHPQQGLIPPDTFIPMIVRKRLNGELLHRILSLALAQAKAWSAKHIHLRIALNLTSFDLLEADLPEMVAKKLAQYQLNSDVLKFEITESTLIEKQALTLETITRLATMGIPTSIDDFGTGYSSLSYLSSLPIDEIKIDRSFIIGMNQNQRNAKIIQAIIALAHSLSLRTVAEGVEDAKTMAHLRSLGCDFIQGFYISRPLDGQTFTDWLQKWNQSHQPKKVARIIR